MSRSPSEYWLWPHDDRVDLFGGKWVDPDGLCREKSAWPYAYSEFYLFGGKAGADASDAANYSDRLWEWDRAKADRLWVEHCKGHRWDNAPIEKLDAFMSAYWERKLEVTALAEGCNPSNGYPYWIVWYRWVKP
jgi:hypothetical protein